MNRGMDEDQVGPFGAQAATGSLAAMGGTIVDDAEDAASGVVGLLRHDLRNKAVERGDTGLALASPEQLGAMNIPGGQIGPGTGARVFMLDMDRPTGRGGQSGVLAPPRLDAGLFVSGDDEVTFSEGFASPAPMIEVKNRAGLGCKERVAREYPTTVTPGAQCILTEPAPQGRTADLRDDALGDDFLAQLGKRPSCQGQAEALGQFASQRLDVNDDAGGESAPVARRVAAPQARAIVRRKSAAATC